MARKLRTFQTSLGFFDLAVAAPSRKAALEAWGAGSNLFHQGIAKETGDPEVVKATLARPGVVLKRPAGSSGRFSEHAELPSQSAADNAGRKPKGAPKHRRTRSMPQAKRPSPGPADKVGRKAAADDGKLQARREAERRRTDAARARVRARQDKAIAKAQAALEAAQQQHEARAAAIAAERAALVARAQAEDDRWAKQRASLIAALRRVRES
jgi:hypothetical protein